MPKNKHILVLPELTEFYVVPGSVRLPRPSFTGTSPFTVAEKERFPDPREKAHGMDPKGKAPRNAF